jgi:hypothetical protein
MEGSTNMLTTDSKCRCEPDDLRALELLALCGAWLNYAATDPKFRSLITENSKVALTKLRGDVQAYLTERREGVAA